MTAAADRRWFEAVASIECCVLCGQHGVQVAHSNRDRIENAQLPNNTGIQRPGTGPLE